MNTLEIALNKESAISVFTSDSMDEMLKKIEGEVLSFAPDVSNAKARKEIASLANKVAKSKVAIDNAGKALTSDWKAKAKLVDNSRKQARDFLDNLKVKVRQPLTDWENEEKRKSDLAKIKAETGQAHDEALSMNDLFDREKAIEEKERFAAEKEQEELRIQEEKRLADEKAEHERLLKEQAGQQARRQAEQEAQSKINEAKRIEAEAIAQAERAKREAEQAERKRLQAIDDARIEKENAVRAAEEKAKREAQELEQKRIADENEARRQAEIASNNLQHQKDVNNEVLNLFMSNGFNEVQAKNIIKTIVKSKNKLITINY